MKIKRLLPFILFIVILLVCVYAAGDRKGIDRRRIDNSASYDEATEELRGVWVSFLSLDTEGEDDPQKAFKQKIDTVIEDMKKANLNTMIVQVRPFSDALYPSEYYPWSHILTGTQGQNPHFDPLLYICDQAHQNHLKVHAWVNPYRVKTEHSPETLSDRNPYMKDKSIGVEYHQEIYLKPSSEKARELITDGVKEIVRNYDVDGIQFDDYFYPTEDESFDKNEYGEYLKKTASPLTLSKWRKENVNLLIRKVYQTVHQEKENVVFGISPQGNLANNETLYADVQKWCEEEGYIDYICPQIYFSLDNPKLSFEDALTDWMRLDIHKRLTMYVGLACYKAGSEADEGTWLDNDDILQTEIKICRQNHLGGFMLYSYESFHSDENAAEMKNVMQYLTEETIQSNSPKQ